MVIRRQKKLTKYQRRQHNIREREKIKYRKENLRLNNLESVLNSNSLNLKDVVGDVAE